MDRMKKDFIIFNAFLVSRGLSVAVKIIKEYNEGEAVITTADLDYVELLTRSDSAWRKINENFANYMAYLLHNERDPERLRLLTELRDTLAKLQSGMGATISMN